MMWLCPQMCVIAVSMVQPRRSNATIWLEVVDYFDGMSPLEFFHHFFVSPMRFYYLGGPDTWVFDKYLRQRGGITMAHKRAAKPAEKQEIAPSFKGFISYELTDEQWDDFDKNFPRRFTSPAIWDELLSTAKLTVTPRDGNFNSCVFPQSGPNAGYALSAFAESGFEAMAIVVYKYLIIREQQWATLKSSEKRKRG